MATSVQQTVNVSLGEASIPLGSLTYAKDGRREYSSFAYVQSWLANPNRFAVSPDLPLGLNHQFRKAPSKEDSVFHGAIADTEPDGWGCRVIARDHAKRRRQAHAEGQPAAPAALTEMDYLLGVDDVSRIGALRLMDAEGNFLRTVEDGDRSTPPLLELAQLMAASRAVELNTETAADLRYLRGRGTSLGGMRPKCTIVDEDGHLAIGKFPSVKDDRSVTRGEVLALRLAANAGIQVAEARIVLSDGIPVALIRRFDRQDGGRIPYLSAGAMLRSSRQEDHSYAHIVQAILAMGNEPVADLVELYKRMAFNLLIKNVDDHVMNHGFLHVTHGQWRLAPAFDLNPFPDKDQELKLWLNDDYGPVDSIQAVWDAANQFVLTPQEKFQAIRAVWSAISKWREVALSPEVGMNRQDLADFEPAFENPEMAAAEKLLRGE